MSFRHPMTYTDERPRPVQVVVSWVLTLVTVGYFLPWAVAATRGKSNTGFVFWLTLLLGWTVVGWVAALVVACLPHRRFVARG